jgi:membrane protein implicated in regulation of membrane protease activity
MNQERSRIMTSKIDTVSEFLVGGGILTMALFPLAIPMVALLIVAALPLLALAALVAVAGAVVALPVLIVRRLSRTLAGMGTDRRRERRPFRGTRPAMGARG